MKINLRTLFITASASILLSACVNFPYVAPLQQGNHIENNRLDLIQEGMTLSQIANTVGTPILQDIFHQNRWDYVYTLQKQYQPLEEKRITVWFENDIAVKVERYFSSSENKKNASTTKLPKQKPAN